MKTTIKELKEALADLPDDVGVFHPIMLLEKDVVIKKVIKRANKESKNRIRDLEECLKLSEYIINGTSTVYGLVDVMDGYYNGCMNNELEQFNNMFKSLINKGN